MDSRPTNIEAAMEMSPSPQDRDDDEYDVHDHYQTVEEKMGLILELQAVVNKMQGKDVCKVTFRDNQRNDTVSDSNTIVSETITTGRNKSKRKKLRQESRTLDMADSESSYSDSDLLSDVARNTDRRQTYVISTQRAPAVTTPAAQLPVRSAQPNAPHLNNEDSHRQSYAERLKNSIQSRSINSNPNIPDLRVPSNLEQFKSIHEFLNIIDPTGENVAAIKSLNRTKQYSIKPTSLSAHAKLIANLEKIKVPHTLLRSADDIPVNVVIHGIPPQYGVEALISDLETLGYQVEYAHNLKSMKTRPPTPTQSWKVALRKTARTYKIFEVTRIGKLEGLKVDVYNAPLRPAQCRRCWRLGHIERACAYPVRCKFCSGNHCYTECTVRLDMSTRKCVNCKGTHSAAYAGCPAYKNEQFRKLERETHLIVSKQKVVNKYRETAVFKAMYRSAKAVNKPVPRSIISQVRAAMHANKPKITRTNPVKNSTYKPVPQPADELVTTHQLLRKVYLKKIHERRDKGLPTSKLEQQLKEINKICRV